MYKGYGLHWKRKIEIDRDFNSSDIIYAKAYGFTYKAKFESNIDETGEARLSYSQVVGHGKDTLFCPGNGYLSTFKSVCEEHHDVVSRACWAVQQKTLNPEWTDWQGLQTGLTDSDSETAEKSGFVGSNDEEIDALVEELEKEEPMDYNYTFKNWIEKHNPSIVWDWDNPKNLQKQFVSTIKESGSIDLKTVFEMFFSDHGDYDDSLTLEQISKFRNLK
jgi:hypothetical protein